MAANVETTQTICTTCGAMYEGSARYCGVDGTALKPAAPSVAEEHVDGGARITCVRCGTQYPAYAKFCSTDGSELQGGSTVSIKDTVVTSQHPAHKLSAKDSGTELFFRKEEDEVIGRTFAGKYKVESLLGEGGMAKVYKATHLEIEKPVVIKLMRQQLGTKEKETSLKRFLQEIKVSAKLNHPNLVSVFDGGEIEGRPYLVMEYIDGESLRDYISMEGMVPFSEAIRISTQACSGLQEAHNNGIIHRDLKPENIMLRRDSSRPDWVKIVDFGIAHLKKGGAKLTATGIAIGTVDYMSPEYLADKPIDHRADIYAIGVILYELLTGRCPFEAESAEAIMAKHLWSTPMPPSSIRKDDMEAGCALDRIVEKALAKEPDERYSSVEEMRKDLEKATANPAKL